MSQNGQVLEALLCAYAIQTSGRPIGSIPGVTLTRPLFQGRDSRLEDHKGIVPSAPAFPSSPVSRSFPLPPIPSTFLVPSRTGWMHPTCMPTLDDQRMEEKKFGDSNRRKTAKLHAVPRHTRKGFSTGEQSDGKGARLDDDVHGCRPRRRERRLSTCTTGRSTPDARLAGRQRIYPSR
eukprot:scaffold2094_cov300-Pavlova_lutheri.AAC.3